MIPIPGTSQPERSIAAFPREFQGSGGGVIQYIHYRGYGSPPLNTGLPGDIFIDMSPDAYRLFIRYEEWREWLGVYRSIGLIKPTFVTFSHPKDKTRTIWCSSADVIWYNKKSYYRSKARLFALDAYINNSFVSAHELILKSGTLSRQSVPVTQRFAAHKDVQLRGRAREKRRISGLESSTQDFPAPQVSGGYPLENDSTARGLLVTGSEFRSDPYPGTRARKKAQTSTSSQAFTVSQPNIKYQVLSIHRRSFESSTSPTNVIAYIQYRGHGVPSLNLGSQGDLFIDKSPGAHRLFVRYQDWLEWPGIYSTAGLGDDPLDGEFLHQEDPTRVVWCTDLDVMWFKSALIRHSKARHFAMESAGASFISAHVLISRSSLGEQIRPKRTLSATKHSGGNTKTKKRKTYGNKSPSEHYVPDSEPSSPAESRTVTAPIPHPESHLTRSVSLSPPPNIPLGALVESTRPSQSQSGVLAPVAREDMSIPESEFLESSPLHAVSGPEKGTTPATPSEPRSSPSPFLRSGKGADSLVHKIESMNGTLPANLNEDAEEAKRARRIQELHTKRKERYQNRRQELVQTESQIAVEEEQLREAEIRAKERLENARQNALKRKEEIQQREEELRKEKEELTARETEVFQREQALKRRKELLGQMEGVIGNMRED